MKHPPSPEKPAQPIPEQQAEISATLNHMNIKQLDMKLSLPNITLIAVTSVDIQKTHHALLYSAENIDFGAIKLLSPTPPPTTDRRVTYVPIPSIDFLGYSRFIIKSLHEYVSTDHCLIVQADGFVLNPELWSPEFTYYDYVGAPWPEFVVLQPSNDRLDLNRNRVGNGGFSLRSKQLLEITSLIDFNQLTFPILSEDLVICHYLYNELSSLGARFAPIDVASRFSIELPHENKVNSLNATFGFHGKHWLPDLVDQFNCERLTRQVVSSEPL
jgi:hypothetical protein